jgi:aflatoxin B1 aldehyde reductase
MNLILGTMNINYPYSSNTDNSNDYYKKMIDIYINYMHKDAILDTAYYYGNTSTEIRLGEIIPTLSILPKIATKVNPWLNNDFTNGQLGQLSRFNLENQFKTSLKNLGLKSVEYLFLHCYDYETELKETVEICDELWRKEKFNHFGVSNFSLDQIIKIYTICEKEGFNLPEVYQGMYNLISRKVEEIFPIITDYSMNFWAYNPLAGGLLTGKYNSTDYSEKNRFTNNKIYQNIFWKEAILTNLDTFFNQGNCLNKSLYWLQYLSMMRPNDKIILGASTAEQLTLNIESLKNDKNVLTQEELNMMIKIYEPIKEFSPNYYY